MKALIKKIPKHILILSFIILVGIFLRTYQFHDWMRFNADQSRDATVVSGFVEGADSLPVLGPKAGGTDFKLGPIFYYFQIVSAKVFGNYPDKMAYPDLFFSILAIPLLFLFLRKYFDTKISLMLTAIFAVSFYGIKYSRFAWNPNSLPFWSILFLYALHSIGIAKEKIEKVWPWPVLVGVALGVGVQLHTLALVFFPIIFVGMFGFLLLKKRNVCKSLLAIIFIALILNSGQILSEYRTHGENTKAFFGGIGTKEKKGSGILNNAEKNAVCFVDANVYVLSSYNNSDTCEIGSVSKGYGLLSLIVGLIFFVGGIFLVVNAFRKEENAEKKYFLGLFVFYFIVSFGVLLPLANEISMRFFLVEIFMPFIFLGLWMQYFSEKFSKTGVVASLIVVLMLLFGNAFSVQRMFAENSNLTKESFAGMDNVTLKEVELASNFIVVHSQNFKSVYLEGDAKYLFKALKSIEYFTERKGVKLFQKSKKTNVDGPLFLIENSKQKKKILENNPGIVEYESMGRFTIFKQN